MKEPRTLEEYENFCKVLKLKIMKQKMVIEDLQDNLAKAKEELYRYKSNPNKDSSIFNQNLRYVVSTDIPMELPIAENDLKGKSEIMKIFKKNLK